jgi:hypothetical protein
MNGQYSSNKYFLKKTLLSAKEIPFNKNWMWNKIIKEIREDQPSHKLQQRRCFAVEQ